MNWLFWKQHRKQLIIFATILVVYAAIALPIGKDLWHTYQDAAANCGKTGSCGQLKNSLFTSGWLSVLNPNPVSGMHFFGLLIMALPFLLGMFVGVPLIAREYSAGTNLLIWTRSISRRKWLTAKLVWTLAATAVFAGVLIGINTWLSRTGNVLGVNRFAGIEFNMQGITLIGYAIFAVSLGAALGALFKRTLLAIGVTLVVLAAMQVSVIDFIRPNYMPPKTIDVVTNQLGPVTDNSQAPKGAWVFSDKIQNYAGQTLSWGNPPANCIVPQNDLPRYRDGSNIAAMKAALSKYGPIDSVNGGPAVGGSCLVSDGYHYVIKYQPAYRYWDFQRIETGMYLALSLIPIAATYGLVLKRDA